MNSAAQQGLADIRDARLEAAQLTPSFGPPGVPAVSAKP